jgi:hypothetical protein
VPRPVLTAWVIAEAIADTPSLHLGPPQVETNLIWFNIEREVATAAAEGARPADPRGRAATGAGVYPPGRVGSDGERAAETFRKATRR